MGADPLHLVRKSQSQFLFLKTWHVEKLNIKGLDLFLTIKTVFVSEKKKKKKLLHRHNDLHLFPSPAVLQHAITCNLISEFISSNGCVVIAFKCLKFQSESPQILVLNYLCCVCSLIAFLFWVILFLNHNQFELSSWLGLNMRYTQTNW